MPSPVWALIGGRMTDRIRAYSYLYPGPDHPMPDFWASAEMAAESAADLVSRGYTAVKFDPAGPYTMRGGHMPAMSDISQSVAFCKAIREAVGDEIELCFDVHTRLDLPEGFTPPAESTGDDEAADEGRPAREGGR